MRTIGIIGGMSWESTQYYYRYLNESIKQRLGGLHSARVLISSLDFADIAAMQQEGHWHQAGVKLAHEARRLEVAGAECIVLATNTMHKVVDQIEHVLTVPFLHIADATALAVKRRGLHRIGLLGTQYTMEQEFYAGRLSMQHGLEVLVPALEERQLVHRVIYQELCQGRLEPESRRHYLEIIASLQARGAEGVILGCTEIGLLITQADSPLPLFDTAALHIEAAVDFALDHQCQP
ncbi:aspartate racemase [Chitinivorax tropicus]|uniref:Aspartate racemase n=1 Tax=Chitinivorax tropicus TaxID=714531 RepID=A0A840MVI0_9PROT|nr:aspartate/glutamate racemase family protein [Chitinivorax tropicus]MBB5020353.1 aspartate racemase [Chitinivorax tropicus]